MAFVGWRAVGLWEDAARRPFDLHPVWLLPAGLAYLAGWLPSVWVFRLLLERAGQRVGYADAARAYYCGHLGKYVPGKALALVIRGRLIVGRGGTFGVGTLAAGLETLISMGAGAAVGVALLPWGLAGTEAGERLDRFPGFGFLLERPLIAVAAVAVGTALALPVLAALFTRLAVKLAPAEAREAVRFAPGVLAVGLAACGVGWVWHGISLWCCVRAVGGTAEAADLLACVGAAGLATAAGFAAVFAPGGVGVREAILIETLSPRAGVGASAVAAAVVLRLVWLASELCAAALLYYVRRVPPAGSPPGSRAGSPPDPPAADAVDPRPGL
ncbi:lysylphosphatidylglycerol synthase domain-containing protein [Alienimonas sp. DA493]